VAVKERGNEVVFLRRIVAGGADKSYGIHVAQLAGLPKKVITRAQRILAELEAGKEAPKKPQHTVEENTMSLFYSSIVNDLVDLDVLSITPLEAINILYKLHNQAKQEAGKL
jgi:DNA mismatch repair protein MutS